MWRRGNKLGASQKCIWQPVFGLGMKKNGYIIVELKHMEGLLGLSFQASELISMLFKPPDFSNKLLT